jgi:putative oxidoreductase
MTTLLAVIGRLLIALLFIISGANKLVDIGGTGAMLSSVGLPAVLAVPTGLFEVIAGLALVFGVLTRLFALLLAAFCLAAAFFFHNDFLDPAQATMLLKDIAIAGGLLCLTALDSVRWSYDAMRQRRRAEREAHRAELPARDAEVRAARAEGVATGARSREMADSNIQGRTVVADDDGDRDPEVRKRRWL